MQQDTSHLFHALLSMEGVYRVELSDEKMLGGPVLTIHLTNRESLNIALLDIASLEQASIVNRILRLVRDEIAKMTPIVDFSTVSPRSGVCIHKPAHGMWRTADRELIPFCLLSDTHVVNIVRRMRHLSNVPDEIQERYVELVTKDIPPAPVDTFFGYKRVTCSYLPGTENWGYAAHRRSTQTDILSNHGTTWSGKFTTFARCNGSIAMAAAHLADPLGYASAHQDLTGCGLYIFREKRLADAYPGNLTIRIRPFGIVVPTLFEDPIGAGFLAEKAVVDKIYIPQYVRGMVYNKMREIHGDVVVWEGSDKDND